MDLHTLTIPELVKGLASKQYSSVEVAKSYLKRIKSTDMQLNSFITVTEKQALKQAKVVDALRASGEELSPIAGIPASVKDVLATKGVKTTASSKILAEYIAPYNATTIDRLEKKGMVMLGKTNCDAFAHGASTENSEFGPSHNPWDINRVPGGSSGGSASSVAGLQSAYSIGTDTGGSIRQPASFCGITALKPTYGRVSRNGLFSMTSSTDVIGPMTRTVEGAAYILEAIAGKDRFDATTLDRPVPRYHAELAKGNIKGMKIGIPKEYFSDAIIPGVRTVIYQAIETYKSMGAEIIEVSLPHTSMAVAVYYILTPSEVSSNLARYDGIRYGFSASTDPKLSKEVESLIDVYTKSRAFGFGDETKRRIMIGTYALSSGYYDAYYRKASKVRTLIRQDFNTVFKEVDMLLTPATPKVAFKLGEQSENPLQMYLEDIFVAPASLAGLPALVIPAGFSHASDDDTINLPVGVQLIAPQFEEAKLLQAGYRFQQETDYHMQTPQG